MGERLATVLRQLRLRAGLTQEELAERSGVSVSTIRGLETGHRRNPRLVSVRQLANALPLPSCEQDELLSAALSVTATPSAPSQGEASSSLLPRHPPHSHDDLHVGQLPELPVPRQLPGEVAYFTGRAAHMAGLNALLESGTGKPSAMMIAAITGTAGVGKTALATHWAYHVRDHFPDGQLYIDLRGYGSELPLSPEEALDGFLRSLRVLPERIPAGLDARAGLYRSLLDERRVLIVLDNAATPEQVRPLLPASPGCAVLMTSRNRLSGLVARDGVCRITLDLLASDEAIALLQEIIGVAGVDVEPDAAGELARHCAYLPLALRIAAERVADRPSRTLPDLLAELGVERDRLDVLAVGDDESTAIRAVFSWSYRILPRETARVFRLLGLHAGPDFSVPAVASLTDLPTREARRQLDALANVHLLEQTGRDRYRFHDLLRAYAIERVRADESEADRHAAVHRMLSWYLGTVDAAEPFFIPRLRRLPFSLPPTTLPPLVFDTQSEALDWCDAERANLVAATRQADKTGNEAIAWKLAASLIGFFYLRKHWTNSYSMLQIGFSAARKLHDRHGEAWTSFGLGLACQDLRRFDEAQDHFQRALTISRETGDKWTEGRSLTGLGVVYRGLSRFEEALDHLGRALNIFRDTGDRYRESLILYHIGATYLDLRQFEKTLDYSRQALSISRVAGQRWCEGRALYNLGAVRQNLQHFKEAIDYFHQALPIGSVR